MGRNKQRSRGQQAFEQLLLGDNDVLSAQPRRSSQRPREERGNITIMSPRETKAMHQLVQIFPTHDEHVLEMVLDSCNGNVQRTVEAVLRMDAAQQPSSSVIDHNCPPASTSTHHPPPSPHTSPCMWDALPNECKQLIFAHLNLRDFARMAATSSEFAETARQLRSHIRHIKPPPEASWESLHGMVAAHRNAQLVGLSKWGAMRCKYGDDYERLFRAVANGSRARVQGKPVTAVELRNAPTLHDTDVAMLCHSLTTLTSMDLTNCTSLTDAALTAVSQYCTRPGVLGVTTDTRGTTGATSIGTTGTTFSGTTSTGTAGISTAAAAGTAAAGVCTQGFSHGPSLSSATSTTASGLVQGAAAALGALSIQGIMHAGAAGGCAPAGDDTGAGGGFRSAGGVDGTDDTNTSNTTSNNTTRSNTTAHANITNSDSNVQSAGGGLVQLRVGGAGQVTEGGVKSLLTPGRPSAASLQLLDVSECGLGALSLTLAHQHVLSSLMAARCRNLRMVRLTDSGDGRLHKVVLQECPQLSELFISSRSLMELNLTGCRSLAYLTLTCPSLTTLYAAQCARLESVQPETTCPKLQHLNMFLCRALHAQGLQTLLQPATMLQTLNVGGCESLTGLHAQTHPHLVEVDAHGCPMLTAVALDMSACLTTLTVRKCTRLQQLRVDCSVLRELDVRNCGALEHVQCFVMHEKQQEKEEGGGQRRRARVEGCGRLNEGSRRTLQRLGFVCR